MRFPFLTVSAVAGSLLASAAGAAPAVTGDYVEARSSNVFIGACHHQGELPSTGRNAVLVWNVTGGEFRGVSLKGVTAVAVVQGDQFLDLPETKRRSVLFVSEKASPAQREAFVGLLRERAGTALGELQKVETAPIRFESTASAFSVEAERVASVKVSKQAGVTCCKQPYEVWGKPMVPVAQPKTGFSMGVKVQGHGTVGAWSMNEANNAFHGQFSL